MLAPDAGRPVHLRVLAEVRYDLPGEELIISTGTGWATSVAL